MITYFPVESVKDYAGFKGKEILHPDWKILAISRLRKREMKKGARKKPGGWNSREVHAVLSSKRSRELYRLVKGKIKRLIMNKK